MPQAPPRAESAPCYVNGIRVQYGAAADVNYGAVNSVLKNLHVHRGRSDL